jgi:hypothetical protein
VDCAGAGRGHRRGGHHRSRIRRQRDARDHRRRRCGHPRRLHQVTAGQEKHRGAPVRNGRRDGRQDRRRRQLGQRHQPGDRRAAMPVGVHQHRHPHRVLGQSEQHVAAHHAQQCLVARQRAERSPAAGTGNTSHQPSPQASRWVYRHRSHRTRLQRRPRRSETTRRYALIEPPGGHHWNPQPISAHRPRGRARGARAGVGRPVRGATCR